MRKPEVIGGTLFSVLLGCFWLGYTWDQDRAPQVEARSTSGFDMDAAEPPRPLVSAGARVLGLLPLASPMPLRDAVASLPRSLRPTTEVPSARAAAAEGWVKGHALFQALLSGPASFMVKQTHLGRPDSFAAFLKDPRRVDGYLSHPLIRGVLDNPAVLRRVLSQPAVVSAFLSSPAMQDPRAVSALASSGFVPRLAERPGVRAVMEDPAFVQQVILNPQTIAWLSRNPRALSALNAFGPAASKALSAGPTARP